MKKVLPAFLIITTLFFGRAKAQPTITSSDAFSIGDVFTLQFADTAGVNEGSSGANQTWNFSSLTANGAPLIQNVVSPASTPFASNFTTADIALDAGGGAYTYYDVNSADMSLIGLAASTVIIPYSDAQKYFQYPFTYNTTFTDNLAATYTLSTLPATRQGTVTFLADGYGTLILPSGTINNVLRVKYTQNIDDIVDYGGGITITTNTTTTTYFWMTPGNENALMDISYITTTIVGFSTESKSVYYYPSNVSAQNIESPGLNVQLFPNPASGKTILSFNCEQAGNLRISLINISGQEVMSEIQDEMGAGLYTREIDLADLTNGTYFVKLDLDNRNLFTRKLIKE